MGADMVVGTNLSVLLKLFNGDEKTRVVVVVGEVGGGQEQEAALYVEREMDKPVVAYIAGSSAPAGKRMGHAGAIVEGQSGSAQSKVEALRAAGAHVALKLHEIPLIVKRLLETNIWST